MTGDRSVAVLDESHRRDSVPACVGAAVGVCRLILEERPPMSVRPAAVAGSFYPAAPIALRRRVEELLNQAAAQCGEPPQALIVPHAGIEYSGPVAASAYSPFDAVSRTDSSRRAWWARHIAHRFPESQPARQVTSQRRWGVCRSIGTARNRPLVWCRWITRMRPTGPNTAWKCSFHSCSASSRSSASFLCLSERLPPGMLRK